MPDELNIEDEWILHEFNTVMSEVKESWESLDIYTATQALKSFLALEFYQAITWKWSSQDYTMVM